jgi:hypothetical protein
MSGRIRLMSRSFWVPKILAANFPINLGYLVPCAVLLLDFTRPAAGLNLPAGMLGLTARLKVKVGQLIAPFLKTKPSILDAPALPLSLGASSRPVFPQVGATSNSSSPFFHLIPSKFLLIFLFQCRHSFNVADYVAIAAMSAMILPLTEQLGF